MARFLSAIYIVGTLLLSSARGQTNIAPFIVQRISEANPAQAYANTAGTRSAFYVAAYGGPETGCDEECVALTNRVHTVLAFTGIPPTASNCELRVNIPPEALLWEASTYTSGGIQPASSYLPTMFLYPLQMPLAQSASWTWRLFQQLQPLAASNYDVLNAMYWSANSNKVIYRFDCPGATGPSGGEIGFIFGIENDISFGLATVFLQQDCSNNKNLQGVYMSYNF